MGICPWCEESLASGEGQVTMGLHEACAEEYNVEMDRLLTEEDLVGSESTL